MLVRDFWVDSLAKDVCEWTLSLDELVLSAPLCTSAAAEVYRRYCDNKSQKGDIKRRSHTVSIAAEHDRTTRLTGHYAPHAG